MLSRFREASCDCLQAIHLEKDYIKPYIRLGRCLVAMHELSRAARLYRVALKRLEILDKKEENQRRRRRRRRRGDDDNDNDDDDIDKERRKYTPEEIRTLVAAAKEGLAAIQAFKEMLQVQIFLDFFFLISFSLFFFLFFFSFLISRNFKRVRVPIFM